MMSKNIYVIFLICAAALVAGSAYEVWHEFIVFQSARETSLNKNDEPIALGNEWSSSVGYEAMLYWPSHDNMQLGGKSRFA
ncbi:hypothetical protein J9978_02670 [Chromobacterium violaceum]|uniref:hypothetical protein n=1 Tax=Chromobacterium violaceum TaxID=536 RepID=UPI00111C4743|nr:hypothetical protein [Chromobacterium violaceum]MBP4048401.1 hypothetical protein [Chromobacterium violaceum]